MSDFPLNPWFDLHFREVGIKNLIVDYGGGVKQRVNKCAAPRLECDFPLKYLSGSDVTTLYNFYVARLGSLGLFTFTYNSVAYTAYFAQDGLDWSWFHEAWARGGTIRLELYP